jgi:hypothetical protein
LSTAAIQEDSMSINNQLAPTPPMGWNSWDCYGTTVREDEVKANADYMAAHLLQHGWNYIVVDIQWSEPEAKAGGYRADANLVMDEYGRLQPATNRFPSAVNSAGFKPLADYVHSKGLKFGIHIMRGIPRHAVQQNLPILNSSFHAQDIADTTSTCFWNDDMYGVDTSKAGAQAYYDSIIALYASWGVDYIKADDMISPYHTGEIEALASSIQKSGRDIVLSLSPGTNLSTENYDHLKTRAELWRISNDLWDRWEDLRNQFDICKQWVHYAGVGCWPDADMLPLGHIGIRAERGVDRQSLLTHDEQYTLMTLWAICRSPLMFGGDLPTMDAFTLSLMTNDEVLAVNQASCNNRELLRKDNGTVIWTADKPDADILYLTLFNIGEEPIDVEITWSLLGDRTSYTLRDLWHKTELGTVEKVFNQRVEPHAARLYELR